MMPTANPAPAGRSDRFPATNNKPTNQTSTQPTDRQITEVLTHFLGTAVHNAPRAWGDNEHITHHRDNVSTSNRRGKDQPRESKGVRQSHGSRAFKRDQAKGYPMSSLNGTKAQRDYSRPSASPASLRLGGGRGGGGCTMDAELVRGANL